MAQSPRPCSHCGNVNLCFMPMALDFGIATTVLGMSAISKPSKNLKWQVTLVVCNQCGFTQTFTANHQELAQKIPGTTTQTVQPR